MIGVLEKGAALIELDEKEQWMQVGVLQTGEVVWSRQFVTVFGNSSYAISVVLCAFMAGLGIGGIRFRHVVQIKQPA